MVKVYFENKRHGDFSELVAVFATEELYMLCLPHLEMQASLLNMTVTESIEDENLPDKFQ